MTSYGTKDDDGRDPRVVFSTLVNIGCCTIDLLPNDVSLSLHDYTFATITPEMLTEASQYKIPAYTFVNADRYSIRHAIYHKGAVAHLFQIGDEWWTSPTTGLDSYAPADINPLRPPKSPVGDHEVVGEHWGTIDGIENSWSDSWDLAGYGDYDLSNYQPLSVLCIDDPAIDFNPLVPSDLSSTIQSEVTVMNQTTDPSVKASFLSIIIQQIKTLLGISQ
jgi:hypothetical protein